MENSHNYHSPENLMSFYLVLVFIVIASSSVVLIEPAPVDIGIVLLFGTGILFQTLKFPYSNILIGSLFLYILVIANLVSMFQLGDPGAGIKYFAVTSYLILSWYLVIGVIGYYGSRAVKILFYGYTLAAMVSAAAGILSYFGIIPWEDILIKFGRVKGLFKDPNVFGPFLIPIALYAYYKLGSQEKSNKIAWALILLTLVLGVFLSYSRAAWGNLALTFIVYFIIQFLIKPSFNILIRVCLTLIILSATLMYVLSIPTVNSMFTERFEYQGYDDDRFDNQAVAVQLGFEYPFGIGPGQYEGSIGYATHSSYLRIWAENGMIGLVGFIGFILATLYRCLRLVVLTKNPILIIVFASAIGLLFNSFVVDTVHWRHLWIIFAIPWAFKFPKTQNISLKNDSLLSSKIK